MIILIKKANHYPDKELCEALKELFYTGFKAKFSYRLFSEALALRIAALFSEYICRNKSSMLMVAESEAKIVGCAYMINHQVNDKYFNHLINKHFSFLNRMKLFLFFAFFSHKVAKEEVYLEFLSVFPQYQNKGVGKKLIAACKKATQEKKLTLYVARNNIPARSLYEKEQFKTVKIERSFIGKFLSGIKEWQFMEWRPIK